MRPRRWDLFEHNELMLNYVSLLLLSPTLIGFSMISIFGFGPEFAHDDRLVGECPDRGVSVFGITLVPTDILVLANDVERVSEGIVVDHLHSLGAWADDSGCDGASRIELSCFVSEISEELSAG